MRGEENAVGGMERSAMTKRRVILASDLKKLVRPQISAIKKLQLTENKTQQPANTNPKEEPKTEKINVQK